MAAFGASTSMDQGRAAAANAGILAVQDERDAGIEQVSAQHRAANERRRARILRSRALAVAGASGAGASDPQITKILTDIETEGEMSALNSLWAGDQEARALRLRAHAQRVSGQALRAAGGASAARGLFQAGADYLGDNPTFFQKYGGDRAMAPNAGIGAGMGEGVVFDEWAG
jgi:hypothetical protein